MSLVPKPKEKISRIHFDMRQLATQLREEGREDAALQCEKAGAAVDRTAKSLGYTGPRIKTTVAYANAVQLYRHVTGKPYGV